MALSYILTLINILWKTMLTRPKIIHIQWLKLPYADYVVYALCKIILKTKIIFTVHNVLLKSDVSRDAKAILMFYRLCDTLVVHTETCKKELIDNFGIKSDKIAVTPHGPIQFGHLNHEELQHTKSRIINKLNITDKMVFSMLGVQTFYKGTDIVIDAWLKSDKLSSNKNIVLLIAGKFVNMDIPQNTDGKNIIIIPRELTDLEFASLLELTDMLLMPYRHISQSGVLLTTIAANIPYCTTKVGELTVPIEMADVGWVIDNNEPHTIEKLILEIIANPEQLNSKKRNTDGWNKVNQYYSWDTNARTLNSIYLNYSV